MLMMQINEADDDHDAAEVGGKLLVVDDDDDVVGKVQQADDAGGREEADLLEEATSHFPSRTSHPTASTSSSSPSMYSSCLRSSPTHYQPDWINISSRLHNSFQNPLESSTS